MIYHQRKPDESEFTAVNVRELEQTLREAVEGEVHFDPGYRAMYSTDGSNYRQVPIGVVLPRHKADVIRAVAACREHGAAILPRGGGTSLAGQTCNVAVVIDFTKYMHRIIDINPEQKRAVFQPGVYLDELRSAAKPHKLTFAPDPATHTHCSLGGMMGNNSCGVHSVQGGKTDDNTVQLEVLTYDGTVMKVGATSEEDFNQIVARGGRPAEIYRGLRTLRDRYAGKIRDHYPDIPRRVSGYNLPWLLPEKGFDVAKALVGSEGTCVVILEATGRLVYSPPVRSLLVLGYPDVFHAADHIMEVLETKPLALEGIDDRLIADMKAKHLHPEDITLLPEGNGWLLIEFGGESKAESDEKAHALMKRLKRGRNTPSMKLFDNPDHEHMVWKIRESGLGATANVPGKPLTWEGWEDSAVPPARAGQYLRDLRQLLEKYGYDCDLYGHFGQGCIHTRIDFDLFNAEGVTKFRSFIEEAADLVLSHGGSLSGEHGDGQSRAELLPKMFGPELIQAFREFKAIWDPDWKMNPGKVVNPFRIDQNLRLGADYSPATVKTYFTYPDDHFSFDRAAIRCVGVGDCRRPSGMTMCPSYMVTREEMHSTRGRARLLFEMLQGDPLTSGWKDPHVRESLDLCLSCKGCKGDCPVNVDMATYKAEFLAHYYEGRVRPPNAYAIGLIYWWARAAALMPGIANFVTQTPPFSNVLKAFAGMHQARELPMFAPQTFKQWFAARPVHNAGAPKVMLWADTWNNHFYPEISKAAVEVLEAAGYQVVVPVESLCCGRPLYDYGFLDLAKKLLNQILDVLRPALAEGMPVVVLEPSCLSVFRDEMVNLLPDNRDAQRLARQSYFFSEFLTKHGNGFELPPLHREAVVHVHCHHKSLFKTTADDKAFEQMGLDYTMLDDGCCGMAGGFGFEAEHYDVSMKCGERVLLPEVEQASKEALIITDGFSCREQILQSTDRKALHLAQVIQMALREGPAGTPGSYPEAKWFAEKMAGQLPENVRSILVAGAGAAIAAGAVVWLAGRLRRES